MLGSSDLCNDGATDNGSEEPAMDGFNEGDSVGFLDG